MPSARSFGEPMTAPLNGPYPGLGAWQPEARAGGRRTRNLVAGGTDHAR